MEKLEIKKNIEKQKALYVLSMFSLVMVSPTFLFSLSGAESRYMYIFSVMCIQLLLYARVKRLNRKLRFLS